MSKLTLEDLERDTSIANAEIQDIINKLTYKYENKVRFSINTREELYVGCRKPVLIVSLKAEL